MEPAAVAVTVNDAVVSDPEGVGCEFVPEVGAVGAVVALEEAHPGKSAVAARATTP